MALYDFYFQSKDPDTLEGFKFFTTGFKRTLAVRGPWKLTLRWMRLFMTPKGSDPLRLDYGTDFTKLIGSNIISTQDLRDVILLAIDDCNSQLEQIQRESSIQPDSDEVFKSAVLTKFELVNKDRFDAWVTISNVEGTEIVAPLPSLATRI